MTTQIGDKITRIEIIDKWKGRLVVMQDLPAPIQYSVQDDERTLKIFVEIEDD